MGRRLILWLSSALALWLVTRLHLGITAQNLSTVLTAAVMLGLVNLLIRPLIRLLALPLTLATFGLFGWVINGFMLYIVSWLVPGFHLAGFGAAVIGAVVLALVTGVFHWIIYRASR
ncbi:MAG: phage holin family protein [Sulfobacillus sp.]|nr:phage holin family protein [Sulfobacillus sp.]